MTCPDCGGETRVTETRDRRYPGRTLRIRKCLGCKMRFATLESLFYIRRGLNWAKGHGLAAAKPPPHLVAKPEPKQPENREPWPRLPSVECSDRKPNGG